MNCNGKKFLRIFLLTAFKTVFLVMIFILLAPAGTQAQGEMALWHFDEGAGSSVYDLSGNNNNGKINLESGGSATLANTWINGKIGKALHFNISSVSVPHSSSLNFSGESFTVFLWVKYSEYMKDSDIIRKGNSVSALSDWKIEITNGILHASTRLTEGTAAIYNVNDSQARNDNKWHAITFTRDTTKISLRVDGSWISSTSVSKNALSNNNAILSIGAKGDPANASSGQDYYYGDIDEVHIYNSEISENQITLLEKMVPTPTPTPIPASTPTPTPILTPTPTPMPTPTPTPISTPKPTPVPTLIPTPTPTLTPTPVPTLIPPTPSFTPIPAVSSYSNDFLIKSSWSPKVYIVSNFKKKWIPTFAIFEELGYRWNNIVTVSDIVFNAIPNYDDFGLIRAVGDDKVYLIYNGIKRHIPNLDVFLDYGFFGLDVKDVSREIINRYPGTRLIREAQQTKIYYLSPAGIKKWVPTSEIFASYNNSWSDIQVISKKEMDSYPESNLMKLGDSPNVYLIEGSTKRFIPSLAVFNKNHYDWSRVMVANQMEFNWFKTGSDVR